LGKICCEQSRRNAAANGNWFSFEDDGRLLVPLFHNTHNAFMTRLRTVGMLVFSPVALTAQLLDAKQLT
jgi:hypothetical protein